MDQKHNGYCHNAVGAPELLTLTYPKVLSLSAPGTGDRSKTSET